MIVYHFLNKRFGLCAIKHCRIKVSSPTNLNDPFEFFGVRSTNPGLKVLIEKDKEDAAKRLGIICCSDTWKNPVMWAHYAERHQGICLGLEVDLPEENFVKMKYVDKRVPYPEIIDAIFDKDHVHEVPEHNKNGAKFSSDLHKAMSDRKKFKHMPDKQLTELQQFSKHFHQYVKNIRSFKFDHWKYERERRLWVNLAECKKGNECYDCEGLSFYECSGKSIIRLKEVIVGLHSKLEPSDIRIRLGRLKDEVEIFKATLHPTDFEMKRRN